MQEMWSNMTCCSIVCYILLCLVTSTSARSVVRPNRRTLTTTSSLSPSSHSTPFTNHISYNPTASQSSIQLSRTSSNVSANDTDRPEINTRHIGNSSLSIATNTSTTIDHFSTFTQCPDTTSTPIQYYAGNPVMLTKNRIIPIYIIWYGTWISSKQIIIRDFLNNLSNSEWLNIQTTYYQQLTPTGRKQYVSSSIIIANEATDSYSQGNSVNDAKTQLIINRAFSKSHLPIDPHAIYFVLTSADIIVDEFCSSICGYHSLYAVNGGNKMVTYAWIGDAAVQCPGSCFQQDISPNGDAGPIFVVMI